MIGFITENSKLIMIFLLIGAIIGLSSLGDRRFRHETRK